jgi:hypothetical protein
MISASTRDLLSAYSLTALSAAIYAYILDLLKAYYYYARLAAS